MFKITAGNAHDALAEARRLLGEEVEVLHTRHCEQPIWLGLRRKQGVEILAAVRQSQMDIVTPVERSRERSPLVARLMRTGVSEILAESVLRDAEDEPQALESIAARMRCGGIPSDGQRRIAIVGPTGVGKTTTAAKLAARYAIFEKKRVALLTLDTYRIGAVEQLATYARIMDIPLEVALSAEDGESLAKKHSDKDVIIIDTVGRSQRNRGHIDELGVFLKAAEPTDVLLALSASADAGACNEAVASFGRLGVQRLVMTKLDECTRPGCILELTTASLLPVSHITYGQDVPDDIAPADSRTLARFVWEGRL